MKIIDPKLKLAYYPGDRSKTTDLICHHVTSDSTVEAIHKYHLGLGWAGIAYNYFVDKKGNIYIGRPEKCRGGHTQNYNHCSIGICFEGNFEKEYMNDAQLAAGQWLIEDIKKRYPGINVGKHSQYNATACPGKKFPFVMMTNPVHGTPEQEIVVDPEINLPSAWAEESWDWAIALGITDGTRPQDNITREQVVTMLWRALK